MPSRYLQWWVPACFSLVRVSNSAGRLVTVEVLAFLSTWHNRALSGEVQQRRAAEILRIALLSAACCLYASPLWMEIRSFQLAYAYISEHTCYFSVSRVDTLSREFLFPREIYGDTLITPVMARAAVLAIPVPPRSGRAEKVQTPFLSFVFRQADRALP